MTKKRLLKFLVDDEVTFKDGFKYGKFGFYFINEILVINEKIAYTIYRIDDCTKIIEDGIYTGEEFLKVIPEPIRSKHKINKEKKKKNRLRNKKHKHKKVIDTSELPYMDAMIGWRINGKINILRTSQFKTKKDLKDYIKKLYPNSEFAFYQFISWDIK